jgi:hypothetical protein
MPDMLNLGIKRKFITPPPLSPVVRNICTMSANLNISKPREETLCFILADNLWRQRVDANRRVLCFVEPIIMVCFNQEC